MTKLLRDEIGEREWLATDTWIAEGYSAGREHGWFWYDGVNHGFCRAHQFRLGPAEPAALAEAEARARECALQRQYLRRR